MPILSIKDLKVISPSPDNFILGLELSSDNHSHFYNFIGSGEHIYEEKNGTIDKALLKEHIAHSSIFNYKNKQITAFSLFDLNDVGITTDDEIDEDIDNILLAPNSNTSPADRNQYDYLIPLHVVNSNAVYGYIHTQPNNSFGYPAYKNDEFLMDGDTVDTLSLYKKRKAATNVSVTLGLGTQSNVSSTFDAFDKVFVFDPTDSNSLSYDDNLINWRYYQNNRDPQKDGRHRVTNNFDNGTLLARAILFPKQTLNNEYSTERNYISNKPYNFARKYAWSDKYFYSNGTHIVFNHREDNRFIGYDDGQPGTMVTSTYSNRFGDVIPEVHRTPDIGGAITALNVEGKTITVPTDYNKLSKLNIIKSNSDISVGVFNQYSPELINRENETQSDTALMTSKHKANIFDIDLQSVWDNINGTFNNIIANEQHIQRLLALADIKKNLKESIKSNLYKLVNEIKPIHTELYKIKLDNEIGTLDSTESTNEDGSIIFENEDIIIDVIFNFNNSIKNWLANKIINVKVNVEDLESLSYNYSANDMTHTFTVPSAIRGYDKVFDYEISYDTDLSDNFDIIKRQLSNNHYRIEYTAHTRDISMYFNWKQQQNSTTAVPIEWPDAYQLTCTFNDINGNDSYSIICTKMNTTKIGDLYYKTFKTDVINSENKLTNYKLNVNYISDNTILRTATAESSNNSRFDISSVQNNFKEITGTIKWLPEDAHPSWPNNTNISITIFEDNSPYTTITINSSPYTISHLPEFKAFGSSIQDITYSIKPSGINFGNNHQGYDISTHDYDISCMQISDFYDIVINGSVRQNNQDVPWNWSNKNGDITGYVMKDSTQLQPPFELTYDKPSFNMKVPGYYGVNQINYSISGVNILNDFTMISAINRTDNGLTASIVENADPVSIQINKTWFDYYSNERINWPVGYPNITAIISNDDINDIEVLLNKENMPYTLTAVRFNEDGDNISSAYEISEMPNDKFFRLLNSTKALNNKITYDISNAYLTDSIKLNIHNIWKDGFNYNQIEWPQRINRLEFEISNSIDTTMKKIPITIVSTTSNPYIITLNRYNNANRDKDISAGYVMRELPNALYQCDPITIMPLPNTELSCNVINTFNNKYDFSFDVSCMNEDGTTTWPVDILSVEVERGE